MVEFRFRYRRPAEVDVHVRVRLFAGSPGRTGALVGVFTMRKEEWAVFRHIRLDPTKGGTVTFLEEPE